MAVPYGGTDGRRGTLILREEVALSKALSEFPDPTEQRGWCLQEGILSHRCVIYSQNLILWKCKAVPYAKDVPGSRFEHEQQLELSDKWMHIPLQMLDTPLDRISGDMIWWFWRFWYLVIELYTRRKLSDPTDRVHAIQGVATDIQLLSSSAYLAGIWQGDLIRGLLWHTFKYTGFDAEQ